METKDFIEACNKKLNCKYCRKEISGSFSYQGGGTISEEALKVHEKECEQNPNSEKGRLKMFILKCQKSADVYDCLNCKRFQKECQGTENR